MASAHDAAAFILEQLGTMTAYKLHKLLYYAQGYSLAWDNAPLFSQKIKAYENGPVVTELFHEHRGRFHVARWDMGSSNNLSDEQRETIRAVAEMLGKLTPDELVKRTHDEAPWIDARATGRKDAEITPQSMQSFFEKQSRSLTPEQDAEADAMAGRMRPFLGT